MQVVVGGEADDVFGAVGVLCLGVGEAVKCAEPCMANSSMIKFQGFEVGIQHEGKGSGRGLYTMRNEQIAYWESLLSWPVVHVQRRH